LFEKRKKKKSFFFLSFCWQVFVRKCEAVIVVIIVVVLGLFNLI